MNLVKISLPQTRFGIFAVVIPVISACFPAYSTAQIRMPNVYGTTPPADSQPKKDQSKNLLPLEELNTLDAKFHKELDAAQEASDREAFGDAEQGFGQLAAEIQDTINRIAVSTFPKNSSIEIDGVKKPATVQTETEWFARTLNKAQHGKNVATILRTVTDMQKQGQVLLSAGKYPEDRDAYGKAAALLVENRSQLDAQTLEFFTARSENGEKGSITAFWGKEFRRLRDRYNQTTDAAAAKMSPEEIRGIVKSVADEIKREGYTDPAKHPDMPEDARALFLTLLNTADQYLGSQ